MCAISMVLVAMVFGRGMVSCGVLCCVWKLYSTAEIIDSMAASTAPSAALS